MVRPARMMCWRQGFGLLLALRWLLGRLRGKHNDDQILSQIKYQLIIQEIRCEVILGIDNVFWVRHLLDGVLGAPWRSKGRARVGALAIFYLCFSLETLLSRFWYVGNIIFSQVRSGYSP